MADKEKVKQFKRSIARNALFVTSWCVNKMPYAFVQWVTRFLIAFGYKIAVRQRRISFESLRIAFGDQKPQKEIERLTKSCFVHVGKGMMELIYFLGHPDMIQERVFFEGKHYLQEAFQKGKGVIAVSAHFGNFPLMLLRFVQEGFPTSAIIRPARDEVIEKYFMAQRTKLGLNTIYSHPRKECVGQSLKVLRNNELLFVPLDQNFGSRGGVFVDFFGQKAATATGPVVFARRTGAPLVPIFIIRQDDDTHKIVIEPPIELEEGKDDQETLIINTARITKIIELYIRRYPQEWGWMHRRWKSRPNEHSVIG